MSQPVQPTVGGAVHSQRGGGAVRRLFRIYLEKPELAGVALLVLLTLVFEIRSNGVFLSVENLRGILGLLPEVGLVSIGVTVLMICGEFDLSVGSMFALMPVSVALMTNAGVPFIPAMLLGLLIAAAGGLRQRFHHFDVQYPQLHYHAGDAFYRALIDCRHYRRIPAAAGQRSADRRIHPIRRSGRNASRFVHLVRHHRAGCRSDAGRLELRQLDPCHRRLR